MKVVYFLLFLTLAFEWCRVFDRSWDSAPEVILSVCSLLNSSDFIWIIFCICAVTSFCPIGISKVGWVKSFANSTGSGKWSLGWEEENNSRSWCGHRKVRVRKYDSGWKLAVYGLFTPTAGELGWRLIQSHPTRGLGNTVDVCARHQETLP